MWRGIYLSAGGIWSLLVKFLMALHAGAIYLHAGVLRLHADFQALHACTQKKLVLHARDLVRNCHILQTGPHPRHARYRGAANLGLGQSPRPSLEGSFSSSGAFWSAKDTQDKKISTIINFLVPVLFFAS